MLHCIEEMRARLSNCLFLIHFVPARCSTINLPIISQYKKSVIDFVCSLVELKVTSSDVFCL